MTCRKVEISQLAFISPEEKRAALSLAEEVSNGHALPEKLDILRNKTSAVDVAMFGRMLADRADKNIEAACQVAHAISVHTVTY